MISFAQDFTFTDLLSGDARDGRKVEDPDTLERIRLTVINNLLKYHPVNIMNALLFFTQFYVNFWCLTKNVLVALLSVIWVLLFF